MWYEANICREHFWTFCSSVSKHSFIWLDIIISWLWTHLTVPKYYKIWKLSVFFEVFQKDIIQEYTDKNMNNLFAAEVSWCLPILFIYILQVIWARYCSWLWWLVWQFVSFLTSNLFSYLLCTHGNNQVNSKSKA
jgi:hypothetical protein